MTNGKYKNLENNNYKRQKLRMLIIEVTLSTLIVENNISLINLNKDD